MLRTKKNLAIAKAARKAEKEQKEIEAKKRAESDEAERLAARKIAEDKAIAERSEYFATPFKDRKY